MDLDDLQALLWLHEHGSLQAAARASSVSRSTLRRRLDRLQVAVGRSVVVLDGSGATLTAAGRALVDNGPALFRHRERVLHEARGSVSAGDRLRILVELGGPPRLTALATATVARAIPSVRLDIGFDEAPLDRLDADLDDHFDAVVYWGDPPSDRPGFTRVLARIPMVVQGAPAYLEERGRPTALADLEGHDLLHQTGMPSSWPLREGGRVELQPRHRCSDLYALGCMAGAGMGLALIPAQGVLVDPSVETLEPVLTDVIGETRRLRIYMPLPTEPGGPAASLVAVLEDILGPLASDD